MEDRQIIIKQIEKIIVFFDLFDFPLTSFEIKEYLGKAVDLKTIIEILSGLSEFISSQNGFYYLQGREEIIVERMRRYNYSNRKRQSAEKFIKIFNFLPFIKVIALANSIGANNLRDGSDIDIFVICAPKRIWLTRFVLASSAKFLNRRPTAANKRDKICLSFYVTADKLNLDSLKLKEGDPYFYYWLRTLVLLYNKDNTYEKFLSENKVRSLEVSGFSNLKTANRSSHWLDLLEIIFKKIQYLIMSPALKKAMNNSIGVVISDQVLKLYLRDNRQEYAEKYGNKFRQIFKKDN